jgi:hypothetical protein
MFEGKAIYFSHKIHVADRKIHALYILFSVSVAYNGVGYQRMQATSHRVGFPAVPEIDDKLFHYGR